VITQRPKAVALELVHSRDSG